MDCLYIMLHKRVVLLGSAAGTGTSHQAVMFLPRLEPWRVVPDNLLQQSVLLLSEELLDELHKYYDGALERRHDNVTYQLMTHRRKERLTRLSDHDGSL